jgi:hypothetical protein
MLIQFDGIDGLHKTLCNAIDNRDSQTFVSLLGVIKKELHEFSTVMPTLNDEAKRSYKELTHRV